MTPLAHRNILRTLLFPHLQDDKLGEWIIVIVYNICSINIFHDDCLEQNLEHHIAPLDHILDHVLLPKLIDHVLPLLLRQHDHVGHLSHLDTPMRG